MDKNKLTKLWDAVESGTGPKKFITLNVSAIAAALTVQETPKIEATKSTKTKKENV